MKLIVKDEKGQRELLAGITPGVVMCGSDWFPGLQVDDGESFIAECAVYAFHEGYVMSDVWVGEDAAPNVPGMVFTVSEASSDELEVLRAMNHRPPAGATIKTADGYTFRVLPDGCITDGDTTYGKLSEMGVSFSLTADIASQIAAFFFRVTAPMTTKELDDWYEAHVGYRLSEDDTTLAGTPEHGYQVAEMMLLHQFDEGDVHTAFLELKALSAGA